MTVLCVDTNLIALYSLKTKVKKIMPDATVLVCNKEEGIRLAEEIKALNPQVNIIFVTAGSAREYAHQLVKVRYSGFLTKPFEFEELKEELGNLRYPQAEVYQRV